MQSVAGHTGRITGCWYSPAAGGKYMISSSGDGTLKLWNSSMNYQLCATLTGHTNGEVLCCSWSPDGKSIVSGGEDHMVFVWNVEKHTGHSTGTPGDSITLQPAFKLSGHKGPVTSVCFNR